ncbi:hypothetical protein MJO29_011715 [Puccinia striiformis f. sp. tritici]|nr:hypothetical protein MJO29_011715 [Puccinia striiformis f. sp. tritici]
MKSFYNLDTTIPLEKDNDPDILLHMSQHPFQSEPTPLPNISMDLDAPLIIVDQSQKRKITGCSSIEAPDNKRVACDKGNDVDDVNAVINDDQRLSISNKFPKSNSKSDNLIDRIFPPVTVVKLSLEGKTLAEINSTVGRTVLVDSLACRKQLYERTRSVARNPALYGQRRGCPLALSSKESQFLVVALQLEPTLYLDEIQRHIEAMTGVIHLLNTISNKLKDRLFFTKKKARKVDPRQSSAQRAAYINQVGVYPSHFFVFMGEFYLSASSSPHPVSHLSWLHPPDESGVSVETHTRDKAWALKGRRTDQLLRRTNSPRVSLMPAVSLDGLLGVIAQPGTMRRLDVEYVLEEVLLPVMNPFPARNSILILDNVKIHHCGRIASLCAEAGILLMYLPPYLPDMNPIEKVFSVLKSNLKHDQIITGTDKDPRLIKAYLRRLVTAHLMGRLYRGSGYEVSRGD